MQKLILLYWGTVFLTYLSQRFYPAAPIRANHLGSSNFMWKKSDLFMALTIAWLCCFSFLRNHYNDSLLSSKVQNKLYNKAPFQGAFCFACII